MKTMNIEKQLQMDREVSSIEKLTVSEGLQYKKEEDGIRAIGPLYLIGSYSDAEGSPVMIRELIDMDVFAPAEKLSEEEFHIDIGEVQAQPQGTQIDVVIELQISGIKEEQEEGHAAQAVPQAQEEEAEDRALVQEDEEADVLSDTFCLRMMRRRIRRVGWRWQGLRTRMRASRPAIMWMRLRCAHAIMSGPFRKRRWSCCHEKGACLARPFYAHWFDLFLRICAYRCSATMALTACSAVA